MQAAMLGLVAGVCLAGGASAATTIVGFEQSGGNCGVYVENRVGNITWDDINKCRYTDTEPDITLGDDGWSSSVHFMADPGTTFTPLAFDIISAWLSLERAEDRAGFGYEDAVWQPYTFDYLSMTGYRNGAVVASSQVMPVSGSPVSLDASFTSIDSFTVALLGGYWNGGSGEGTLEEDGYWYRCAGPSGQCHAARIDNLVVDVVAPVPLPASGVLLAFGLIGLAAAYRLRR